MTNAGFIREANIPAEDEEIEEEVIR